MFGINNLKRIIINHFEQIVWIVSLAWLYFMGASASGTNSFCIFKLIGFDSCIGCGIGHSIHYALHFDFLNSYKAHFFGIPATLFIILQVFKPFFHKNLKNNYYGPATAYDVKGNSTR